jgi:hypothetical protein
MLFFLCALLLMFIARKIGWDCSKTLYSKPMFIVIIFGLLWGIIIAYSIYKIILWQEPNSILRWVMGYFMGAYIAIPNFGLLDESSIPDYALARHVLLKIIPLLIYIASIVLLNLHFF